MSEGVCWGFVCLHGERTRHDFSPEEASLLAGVSAHVAEALRTSLIATGARSAGSGAPGVLELAADGAVVARAAQADAWLAEIEGEAPGGDEGLPAAVHAVVAQLRAIEADPASAAPPRLRLRGRSGRWLVLHASRLRGSGGEGRTAVVIEQAHPREMAPLIAQVYGLSRRERDVCLLIVRGRSTAEVAMQLHISATTVQDHLKAIFTKLDVHSRRDVVAKLLTEQYLPRALAGAPIGRTGFFS